MTDDTKSWVLVRKTDGKRLLQIFSAATLDVINTDDYKAVPTPQTEGMIR